MLPYIVIGEALFWVFLLAGVCARYLLRWRTASTILLIATPLIDIVIIVLTYIDLYRGATSDFSHGLAAFYVGFSVVFGPELIARVDRRFAKRYSAQESAPAVPSKTSLAYWLRCLTASSITIALLIGGIVIAGLADSFWLIYWMIVAVFTTVSWAVVGPVRDRWRRRRNPNRNGDRADADAQRTSEH
ncbi:hypothetical protein [Brevibacterium spongiae]|uniref:Membrane protein YmcC n=1 Tax=Brevibacterium spongiae TaxID=2909672 RepID=A0ABY5SUQ4_9MICO|nr:hypothetical protein [Brevibacterium spongiae]UVI36771.1 hypothetical protein L1F31_03645 [Brevibacterium spongiae]